MATQIRLFLQWPLAVPVAIVGALAVIGGILIFAGQVIAWMKSGHWVGLPLLYLFFDPQLLVTRHFSPQVWAQISSVDFPLSPAFVLQHGTHIYHSFFAGGEFSAWLNSPQSWLGLHKPAINALKATPIPLALALPGAILSLLGKKWLRSIRNAREALKLAKREEREREKRRRPAVVEWEPQTQPESEDARLERISSWFRTLAKMVEERPKPIRLPIREGEGDELALFHRGNEDKVKSTAGYKMLVDKCTKFGLEVRFEPDYSESNIEQTKFDDIHSLAPTMYHVYIVVFQLEGSEKTDGTETYGGG